MGIVKKHGIINTIIAYLGVFLGFLNTALLFTHFLTTEQLGLTRILTHAAMIFAQLSALGMGNTVLRYFPVYKSTEKKQYSFLLIIILIGLLGFLLISLLCVLFKGYILAVYESKSQLFVEYFFLIFPIIISLMLFNIVSVYSNSIFRSVAPTIINDIVLRLFITISITLFIVKIIDFKTFIYLFTLSYSSTGILLVFYLLLKGNINFFQFKLIPFKEIIVLLKYGLISLVTGFTNIITLTIDSLMIGAMLGLSGVGIYSIAVYFVSLIMIPVRSIYKITNPLVAEYWSKNDIKSIEKIYKKTSINNLIIVLLIFLCIWVNIKDIYHIMPREYSEGMCAFLFLALARIVDATMSLNRIIIRTSSYFKVEALLTILFAFMVFILNYIFIKKYDGIVGAALGTMFSVVVFNIACTLFVKGKFNIQPFSVGMLQLVLFAVISWILASFFETNYWWFNIIIKSSIVFVVFIGLTYICKVSEDFNELLYNTIKRFKLR